MPLPPLIPLLLTPGSGCFPRMIAGGGIEFFEEGTGPSELRDSGGKRTMFGLP